MAYKFDLSDLRFAIGIIVVRLKNKKTRTLIILKVFDEI